MSPKRSLDFDVSSAAVPRDKFPTGRVKFSLGVDRAKDRRDAEARRRRERLTDLVRWGAWDILYAVQQGSFDVSEVCRRVSQGGEAAVSEIRRDIEAAAAGGIPTVTEEAARFLDAYEKRGVSAHSVLQRRSALAQFRRHKRPDGKALGDVPIDEVTSGDILNSLIAISSSVNTREGVRSAVSAMYTWTIGEEAEAARVSRRSPRWTVNPAALVDSPSKEKRIITASRKQVLALVAAAEPYQLVYLRAFLHLGLREGELMHTRFHLDLDVDTWLWRIQTRGPDARCACPSCQAGGWRPKTPRSHRTLLVPPLTEDETGGPHPLRAELERYLSLYPAGPGDFVFRNPRTGGSWHARALADDFARLCARAEVRYGRETAGGITLHTLRHTCATDLVRRGVRESVIAAILGDTVKTVVDTYVHLTPEDLADGVAKGSSYVS